MQSLALDVNVVSEEGQRAEMRDEDDDLLRAAEELGIDLSGVRALTTDASDEELEGEDATDATATGDTEAEAETEVDGETEDEAVPADDLIAVDVTEDVDLKSLASEEPAE
jgi:DNA-directed RNA polymerase subunit beta